MEDFVERDRAGLWRNGSFPLGLARRCAQLMGSDLYDDEIAACRRLLRDSSPETVIEARCSCHGSRRAREPRRWWPPAADGPCYVDEQAQRLAREAMFLLVFGQTPAMRAEQLSRYRQISAGVAAAITAGDVEAPAAGQDWWGPVPEGELRKVVRAPSAAMPRVGTPSTAVPSV